MEEGRKRVLLIAASILAARGLADWNGSPSPKFVAAISDSIRIAERIMQAIDDRWPESPKQNNYRDLVRPRGERH